MITHTSDRDEVTVISVYDLQSMVVCPEEESVLMTSFVSDLSALTLKQCNFYSIIFAFIIIKISKCQCLFKISFFFYLQWSVVMNWILKLLDLTGYDYRYT